MPPNQARIRRLLARRLLLALLVAGLATYLRRRGGQSLQRSLERARGLAARRVRSLLRTQMAALLAITQQQLEVQVEAALDGVAPNENPPPALDAGTAAFPNNPPLALDAGAVVAGVAPNENALEDAPAGVIGAPNIARVRARAAPSPPTTSRARARPFPTRASPPLAPRASSSRAPAL